MAQGAEGEDDPTALPALSLRPPGDRAGRDVRTLRIAGTLAILVVLGAAVWLAWHTKHSMIADRQREMENLALTLSEQTDRALKSLDLVQEAVIEDITAAGVATTSELDAVMGTIGVHRILQDRIDGLPFVDAVTLINATGRLINFSRYWPIPPVNVSDRDYFKALEGAGKDDSFIGLPVQNRGTGTMTIYLAHRFTNREGAFLGLVLGAMEQSYFETYFSAIDLGRDGAIALFRDDGAYIAGYPHQRISEGAQVRPQARALLASGERIGEAPPGTIDGEARYYAQRHLAGFPLTVLVTDSTEAVGERIFAQQMPILGFAGLMCLAILGAVGMAERHLKEQSRFAQAAHYAARHDSLTGLPNRLGLTEHLHRALASPEARPVALLLLDLDYFKTVNDTLGHMLGDTLLREVARRILERTPQDATLARFGGDEFALVLHRTEEADALRLAAEIVSAIKTPVDLGHHRVIPGGSCGVALASAEGETEDTLLRQADLALYRAKSEGRGLVRLFSPDLERSALARRVLELDLDTGFREKQFFLLYQPICAGGDGRIVGFEALLRWRHPTRGVLLPSAFMPTAEAMGLILPLGSWALETACLAAMDWPSDLFVSVNISPVQLRADGMVAMVKEALAASGLRAGRLQIEVPEKALAEDSLTVLPVLTQLRALGVRIALDAFGASHASFAALQALPVDRIKIAQALMRDVSPDSRDLLVLRALLAIAEGLPGPSIVSGVRTEDQFELLSGAPAVLMQGDFVGRPLPLAEASTLARAGHVAAQQ